MKLYHLTHEDYVPSILSKGLIPGYSKGMKVNPEKPSNYVFLTDNIEHVLKQNMYRSGWIVLEVDIEGLDVKQHITRCFEPGKNIPIPNEFIFEGIIEPKRIKVNQELSSFKKPETQPREESNMKINQSLVTKTFQCRNGTMGSYYDLDDVHCIKDVLTKNLGISISESEVIDFWKWRCEEWDGSWFGVDPSHTDVSDIQDWFEEFIKFVGVETDEDEENISEPPLRVGVKVVVKDVDGSPWEVELDPNYHSQLISEIESQIPEKSERGTIRYSLDYDPAKVWNVRKLES